MKLKFLLIWFFVFLFIISFLAQDGLVIKASPAGFANDLFVGVDIAYYNMTEFKAEVDEISAYTNLVVIGTSGISYNTTLLNETCQYVYDKGLSFIIYAEYIRLNQTQWYQNAVTTWGDRFLGIYSGADEYGGKQVDLNAYRAVWEADDYTDAANQFVANLTGTLKRVTRNFNDTSAFPLFISDYALYWFDYKAGVNTVFAEFGWNYSRQLNIALCRGAATVQNRDWGVMMVWRYTHPPYLESGPELYQDLITAYDSGAKYILTFDSNVDYTHGTLKAEHLNALKQFWQYAQSNPRKTNPIGERVACVLPKDYAYGFRGPNDKIWGLWEADSDPLSYNMSISVNGFLEVYGDRLDIIYDDGLTPGNTYGYSQLLPWDIYVPKPQPSPSSSLSPSPIPSSSPSPSSSTLPSPDPTQLQTPSPTSSPNETSLTLSSPPPSLSPTELPSSTPEHQNESSFPTLAVCTVGVFAGIALFAVGAVNSAGKQPEKVVKPMKLTFQGTWIKAALARVHLMGQCEVCSSNVWRSKYTGVLETDWSTDYSGKVTGTLALEGEKGESLFVNVTGTQLTDGSHRSLQLSGSYEVNGGTGRFLGATGHGAMSAQLRIGPDNQRGTLTDGLMVGNIVLRL